VESLRSLTILGFESNIFQGEIVGGWLEIIGMNTYEID
jgi:hypothetical protein